jgi:hypothetical protein
LHQWIVLDERTVQKCVSRHDYATVTTFPLRLKSRAREICLFFVFRNPRFRVPCSTHPPCVPVFRVPLNPRGTQVARGRTHRSPLRCNAPRNRNDGRRVGPLRRRCRLAASHHIAQHSAAAQRAQLVESFLAPCEHMTGMQPSASTGSAMFLFRVRRPVTPSFLAFPRSHRAFLHRARRLRARQPTCATGGAAAARLRIDADGCCRTLWSALSRSHETLYVAS